MAAQCPVCVACWGAPQARPQRHPKAAKSQANPRAMVSLFFLLGDSAKHLSEDVSTTVSQNETTGSATLTSTSERSWGGARAVHACLCGGRGELARLATARPCCPAQRARARAAAGAPPVCLISRHVTRASPGVTQRTRVHLAQVLHHAVQVQLARPGPFMQYTPVLKGPPAYISRRSFITLSRYSSPVPRIVCSPDSSTCEREN